MAGQPTPAETLERLRKEAKRRLKAFKTGDEQAVRWFQNAIPSAPADPTLRDNSTNERTLAAAPSSPAAPGGVLS